MHNIINNTIRVELNFLWLYLSIDNVFYGFLRKIAVNVLKVTNYFYQ